MAYESCRQSDFEAFVGRHENRLYRTALAIMGSRADAEDAVQETFLRAYEKAPAFETQEHERAWLIRTAVNLCRSRLRSPWRRRTDPLPEAYPAADPEEHRLLERVMELPPKHRAVIHLFYYEGYPVKEIAALTGQRESTVRSLLTRARQRLKALLKEDDYEGL